MNVERSTFMRKGYLFTALAVAVLLAGSSGTAWAQTITASSRFTRSSATLQEGADDGLNTPAPLKVTIRRSTKSRNDPYNTGQDHLKIAFEYNGAPVSATNGGSSFEVFEVTEEGVQVGGGTALTIIGTGDELFFGPSGVMRDEDHDGDSDTDELMVNVAKTEIFLTIEDVADDGDWIPEKLVLTLSRGPGAGMTDVRDFTSKFTVTITDDDPQPVFNFDPNNIQLAEGNEQTVMVGVGIGAGGEGMLPEGIEDKLETLTGSRTGGSSDSVLLSVSPAAAVGREDDDRGIISIGMGDGNDYMDLEPDGQGRYNIGTIMEAVTDDGIPLKIKAKDVTGFRDEMISFMLMDGRTEAQIAADGGVVGDAAPATVTVLSGEETPTVTFSTESISIDEGDSETVHLLADSMQGDEVGSAAVRVRGDADISLEQNGNAISGSVSFGGHANAELTIIANSDPSLEDGEEKTATVTITDASGALIGDPNTVTVTVVGSTAVPVFPLFGQLLLALLLMVGGARLYRRRQG